MNKIKQAGIIFVSLVLFTQACINQKDSKTVQDDKHWLVLDVKDAKEVDGKLSWDFQLSCRGTYNVQILRKGEQEFPFPEVSLESAGTQINEAPGKIFVLDKEGEKQTIFQFKKDLFFSETGVYSLKTDANALIEQVRIIPNYRNHLGFSTGIYDQQWLAMHNSPEKQAAMVRLKENKYGMFIHWGSILRQLVYGKAHELKIRLTQDLVWQNG